jgi:hypothetical protein
VLTLQGLESSTYEPLFSTLQLLRSPLRHFTPRHILLQVHWNNKHNDDNYNHDDDNEDDNSSSSSRSSSSNNRLASQDSGTFGLERLFTGRTRTTGMLHMHLVLLINTLAQVARGTHVECIISTCSLPTCSAHHYQEQVARGTHVEARVFNLQSVKMHVLVFHPVVPRPPNHFHERSLLRYDCIFQALCVVCAEENVEVQSFLAVKLPGLYSNKSK